MATTARGVASYCSMEALRMVEAPGRNANSIGQPREAGQPRDAAGLPPRPETRHVLSPALSLRLPHRGQRRAVRLWRRLRGGAAALSPAATRSRRRRPAGPGGHAGRGGHLDLRDDRQRRPRHLSPPARRQPAARLCLAAGRVHRCRRGALARRWSAWPAATSFAWPSSPTSPSPSSTACCVAASSAAPRSARRGRWASARRAWAER